MALLERLFLHSGRRHTSSISMDLRPVMYAGLNDLTLQTLGQIISVGYLTCGFLPIRIAFPTLAAILLRSTLDLSADILFDTFKASLTHVDLITINEALQCKSSYPQTPLICFLAMTA